MSLVHRYQYTGEHADPSSAWKIPIFRVIAMRTTNLTQKAIINEHKQNLLLCLCPSGTSRNQQASQIYFYSVTIKLIKLLVMFSV
jgi:hypothetical protein